MQAFQLIDNPIPDEDHEVSGPTTSSNGDNMDMTIYVE